MNNNDENDIYVIDDEPTDSGFLIPWWIFLLPFLLIGGLAIAYITNANKYKSTTKPEIPPVENTNSDSSATNNNVTESPDSDSSATNNNVTVNPDSDSSTTNNNVTVNPDSDSSATNNNVTVNPDSDSSTPNNRESLEITEKVYFAYKETEVLSSDTPKLESFLSKLPGTTGTLIIAGHSDDIGSDEYNQNLARQRAEQVASKLRELGLDQQYQVKIESWGETQPTGDNETEQGRSLNRRVVLYFSNAN